MLEGLEVSEIKYSYLKKIEVLRFDSNYYSKTSLFQENIIRKNKYSTLKDLGVSLLSFGAYSLNNNIEYLDSGIPFIRGINLKNGSVDFENMVFINDEANKLLWKSEVEPETILLSMSGTIGDVALASKNWNYPINSNQDIAKIRCNGKYNPYLLYTFLRSKFGQNYLNREARGSVQQHVFLSQMELFEVPIFSDLFDSKIEEVIEFSNEKYSHSKSLYSETENMLLTELGFSGGRGFETRPDSGVNCSVKTLKESFLQSGRIDAEYYQPKYDEIFKIITNYKYGYTTLSNLTMEYSTGFPFDSDRFVNEGFPLIRISNIKKGYLDIADTAYIPVEDIELSKKDLVKENDLLLSMSGTIGNCCKIEKNINAIINQRILRFSVKDYNADVLCLLINSIVCELQLNRVGTGGVQTNISGTDIFNLIIPKIDTKIQTTISQKIQESFKLKTQSKQLLEAAKIAVEIAIEQGEREAMAYLKKYIE